jgi:ABC-type amino acid transport substrate-binding protein
MLTDALTVVRAQGFSATRTTSPIFSPIWKSSLRYAIEARTALKNGAVDAHFRRCADAEPVDGKRGGRWVLPFAVAKLHRERLFRRGIAIAVDVDDPDLRDALNYAMAEIYREGRYFEIFLRYFRAATTEPS